MAAVGVTGRFAVQQQISIGAMLVPPHPAAQLVQIGQPVIVRLVDEDGVDVGNVQAAFDDGRGHQDVAFPADEA